MRLIGNILWFLFGGFLLGLSWFFAGILWCDTIIGIPRGLQSVKFANLTFCPFGKDIQYGGGAMSLLANIIWLLISGLPLAIEAFVFGCLWCVTIIGIPWGKQYFKLAKLALMPFGATVGAIR